MNHISVSGQVTKVIDADTIVVKVCGEFHIRLLGVYAPEKNTPEGMAGKIFLESLVKDKSVGLEIPFPKGLTSCMSFDRVLAKVNLEGKDLADHLVENNMGKRKK